MPSDHLIVTIQQVAEMHHFNWQQICNTAASACLCIVLYCPALTLPCTPSCASASTSRFPPEAESCTLYRCAIHWDDAALRHELVMRPVGLCNNDNWHWSGGFQLSDKYALLHYQILLQCRQGEYTTLYIHTDIAFSSRCFSLTAAALQRYACMMVT